MNKLLKYMQYTVLNIEKEYLRVVLYTCMYNDNYFYYIRVYDICSMIRYYTCHGNFKI